MNGIQAYSNCGALQTNEMLLFYTHKHTHGGCNAMCNASIGNSMFDFLKKRYSKTYFRRFISSAYFSLSLTLSRSGFWVNFSAFKPFTISIQIFSRRKKKHQALFISARRNTLHFTKITIWFLQSTALLQFNFHPTLNHALCIDTKYVNARIVG